MAEVSPLIFEPLSKPRVWGGQRLRELLGKELPTDGPIGESWELVDLDDNQSVVRVGPARGRRLHELVNEWGRDLLGTAEPVDGRFPLMVKFLDAREPLSVQVHPRRTETIGGHATARVKHEMWYVLADAPGAVIYRGLKPGVDRQALAKTLAAGNVESLLQTHPAKPGSPFHLPAGTVHALGGGIVVAEVSSVSDTTYRLYDWDRIDPATGRPRPLHVEEALDAIDFGPFDASAERRSHVTSMWTTVTRLVTCESFAVERVRMTGGVEMEIPYADLVIWIVLEGRGQIRYKGGRVGAVSDRDPPLAFKFGDVVLLPAALREAVLKTDDDCLWLEITIPGRGELAGSEPRGRTRLSEPRPSGGKEFVQISPPGRGT